MVVIMMMILNLQIAGNPMYDMPLFNDSSSYINVNVMW